MVDVVISDNVSEVRRDTLQAFQEFPQAIDAAMGRNARVVLAESISQIDALIYATPGTPGYRRTKNLRRSNKIRQIGKAAWLVYNDAEYAGYVHDGTSSMLPRPWMKNAIDAKEGDMERNLVEAGMRALGASQAGLGRLLD